VQCFRYHNPRPPQKKQAARGETLETWLLLGSDLRLFGCGRERLRTQEDLAGTGHGLAGPTFTGKLKEKTVFRRLFLHKS